jgi:hypothetical protein
MKIFWGIAVAGIIAVPVVAPSPASSRPLHNTKTHRVRTLHRIETASTCTGGALPKHLCPKDNPPLMAQQVRPMGAWGPVMIMYNWGFQ